MEPTGYILAAGIGRPDRSQAARPSLQIFPIRAAIDAAGTLMVREQDRHLTILPREALETPSTFRQSRLGHWILIVLLVLNGLPSEVLR